MSRPSAPSDSKLKNQRDCSCCFLIKLEDDPAEKCFLPCLQWGSGEVRWLAQGDIMRHGQKNQDSNPGVSVPWPLLFLPYLTANVSMVYGNSFFCFVRAPSLWSMLLALEEWARHDPQGVLIQKAWVASSCTIALFIFMDHFVSVTTTQLHL